MTRKLKLSPDVSYFLGVFAYSGDPAVGITTSSSTEVERFVSIAVKELGVEPEKVKVEQVEDALHAYFYHSKLKKLLSRALERRAVTFKHKNDYAANYLAGIFDVIGGRNAKGLYMEGLGDQDQLVMENLGFHTLPQGRKLYLVNQGAFAAFIGAFSCRMGAR